MQIIKESISDPVQVDLFVCFFQNFTFLNINLSIVSNLFHLFLLHVSSKSCYYFSIFCMQLFRYIFVLFINLLFCHWYNSGTHLLQRNDDNFSPVSAFSGISAVKEQVNHVSIASVLLQIHIYIYIYNKRDNRKAFGMFCLKVCSFPAIFNG